MALIKLELAKFCIKRYLERLNRASDLNDGSKFLGYTSPLPIASSQSKEHSILNIRGALLDDDEFITLLPVLAKLTLVTELNLEVNSLTGISIAKLREFLPNLERLNLSRNNLDENQGCIELAKFTRLIYLNVVKNNLKSEDLEKLQDSNSLLKVFYHDNPKIDIVRKARLEAALDYNNRVRIQASVGASKMSEKKGEYIKNNFAAFVKMKAISEKESQWLHATLRGPTPQLSDIPGALNSTKIK